MIIMNKYMRINSIIRISKRRVNNYDKNRNEIEDEHG